MEIRFAAANVVVVDGQARVFATATDSVKLLPELDYLTVQITERRYGRLGRLDATLGVSDIARQVPQCNSGLPDHLPGSRGPIAGDGFFLGGPELDDSLQAIDDQIRMSGDFGYPTGLHKLKLLANHAGYTRKSRWWWIDFHYAPFQIRVW
jgi:hypothetical protein